MAYDSDTNVIVRKLYEECGDWDDARRWFDELREQVAQGEDPEELLHEIGLEPDYVFALL
jgi:predicted nucleic acid-binding protein